MREPREGISPIMATLILLVIAIAAGLVAWMWINGWLGWQLYQAGIQVKIDDVTVQDGYVHVVIRNVGSSTATVDRVFIENLEYDAYAKIQPGDNVELEFPYAWTYRTAIKVKVILESGHTAEWKSPIRVPEVPFALEFNGAQEQAYASDASDLDLHTFTIECWIKITKADVNRWTPIVVKGQGSFWGSCNYGFCLYRYDPEQVEVIYWGEDDQLHYSAAKIPGINEWFHLVGVFDGGHLNIYINGRLEGSEATTATPATNDDPLCIGYNNYYELANYFIIDELRIYSRPLSIDEIKDNIRGKITTDGLVLWYRFDEGTGNSVKDVSGAGHTASFGSSAPSWVDGVEKSDVDTIITSLPLAMSAAWAAPARRDA